MDDSFRVAIEDELTARHPVVWVRAPQRAALRPSFPDAPDTAASTRTVDLGRVLVPSGTGVRGRVVDARGAPIAEAHVLVSLSTMRVGAMSRPASVLCDLLPLARTDAAGEFVADDRVLPGSDTLLVAVPPHGAGCAGVDATRARRGLDVDVQPFATAGLTVKVIDGGARPVAGARVVAEPRWEPLGTLRPEPSPILGVHPAVLLLFSAPTDADGRATLPFLPLGPDATEATDRAYDVVVDAGAHPTARRPVQLDPQRPTTLTVALDAPVSRIEGHVAQRDGRTACGRARARRRRQHADRRSRSLRARAGARRQRAPAVRGRRRRPLASQAPPLNTDGLEPAPAAARSRDARIRRTCRTRSCSFSRRSRCKSSVGRWLPDDLRQLMRFERSASSYPADYAADSSRCSP
ncbi:MAG: carboxypeptidase-like regulatory domain-containing protein [Planctomycetota bacterium]